MAEEKGLNKPVKLKADLAAFLGASALPRTEITKKLWDYIKAHKLQTSTVNGKPENAGKFIVADARLVKIFNNTKTTTKSGKVVDFTKLREGETIDMMQMAAVVNNSASLQLSEAVSVTVDTIEKLKNLGLTSTSFGPGNHSGAAVTSAEGRVFTPTWNVSAIGSTKARNVTVTVTWEEKGMSHSTALSFVKGPNQP